MSKAWRLTLVNNIPTHHQMPVALQLHRLLGDRFRCVFLHPVDAERSSMGWSDPSADAGDWVVRAWESPASAVRAREEALGADVALFGTFWSYAPIPTWTKARLAKGLPTLGFSERRSKPSLRTVRRKNGRPIRGPLALWTLMRWHKIHSDQRRTYANPQCHFLPIGAAAAKAEADKGLFLGRMWKYAYFTDVPDDEPPPRPDGPLRILYVGRLLSLKRVSDLLDAAGKLSPLAAGIRFEIVGDGPEKDALVTQANALGLQDAVAFKPSVPASQVRGIMRQADVLFLGSNDEEGWGAVVNEGMAEGCVPVVSSSCGATGYLVHDGTTGYKFPVGDVNKIAEILERLAKGRPAARELGRQAWRYVHDEWSPAVAAERLVEFGRCLVEEGRPANFPSGPLSPATED